MMIYDCFTFYNEFDLLKIRLQLLSPVVDYFVLVEMNKTQTGIAKPMFFAEHREEFAPYLDKIIYVPVTDTPEFVEQYGNWLLENFQRNAILRGLTQAQADDLIIVSDLDEFPRPEILRDLARQRVHFICPPGNALRDNIRYLWTQLCYAGTLVFKRRKNGFRTDMLSVLDVTPVILEQDVYYYYLNCRSEGVLHGSVIFRYKNLILPHSCRTLRYHLPVVKNAGWHFSYMGGRERIKNKLRSIVEGEFLTGVTDLDAYIDDCLARGVDIYGRKGREFRYSFIASEDIGLADVDTLQRDYPHLFAPNA